MPATLPYVRHMQTSPARISVLTAAARLGMSRADTLALVESGKIRGHGSWVWADSLKLYLSSH
jgi:hypothetical protein